MNRTPWIPGVVALLVLAGCSSPPTKWAEPECPLVGAQNMGFGGRVSVHGGVLPDDFEASWVLRCRIETRDVPGKGETTMVISERADEPVSELVDALDQSSEIAWWWEDFGCAAVVEELPYFVLVDAAGRALEPPVPVTVCDFPLKEARDALDALKFRTLSETTLRERWSLEPVDNGCEPFVPNPFAGAEPGPAVELAGDRVRVCDYSAEGRGTRPDRFSHGYTTTGDAARALLGALAKAGPAGPCTARNVSYVLLHVDGPVKQVAVELDGCRRVVSDGKVLGQVDERLTFGLAR